MPDCNAENDVVPYVLLQSLGNVELEAGVDFSPVQESEIYILSRNTLHLGSLTFSLDKQQLFDLA